MLFARRKKVDLELEGLPVRIKIIRIPGTQFGHPLLYLDPPTTDAQHEYAKQWMELVGAGKIERTDEFDDAKD